jgi:hypothetical protein
VTKLLMIAMPDSLLTLESSKNGWKTHESLKGTSPQCIAFDSRKPNRAYCGTFGNGLWKTDDSGQSWESIGNKENEIEDSILTNIARTPRTSE